MKENSYQSNIKHIEETKSNIPNDIKFLNKENAQNFLEKFFSFKSSFYDLKESKIFHLNIIKSKISLFEDLQPIPYKFDISSINEIFNKYKNYVPTFLDKIDKINKKDLPSFINLLGNKNTNSIELLNSNNLNKKENGQFSDLIENFDFYNLSFTNCKNNLTFFEKIIDCTRINDNLFLNQKRKNPLDEPKKKLRKNMVFISNRKNKKINIEENRIQEEEEENNDSNKKIIFRLLKSEKNRNKLNNLYSKDSKLKKQPGRKKIGSGEKGTHNKFSKDNMMRKLKNKVMESARKLINKMIKDECDDGFKYYREIRKIEGIYSQELNIKYNFWFYFQKLKDIFQFKMSSKYSKGDLNSNTRLIYKIYSPEKRNKFPKTIQLLEMQFYEYYHDIFLGEKKDWFLSFNIKEKDNSYELGHFLNNDVSKKDDDYFLYRKTIINLAHSYELFFLKRNPRFPGNKNIKEKESHSKEIIKLIPNEQLEAYKFKFIATGVFYVPNMNEKYGKYLNDNIHFQQFIFPESNTSIINNEILSNNENVNNFANYNNNEIFEKKIFNSQENDEKETQNKTSLINDNKKPLFNIIKEQNSNSTQEIANCSTFEKKGDNEKILDKIFNTIHFNDNSSQKIEKEIQTENLIPDEASQNIEIII